ncbi:hypothetical protein T265_02277 [Opisthorchis viverrini]|uniref:Uncharacterized protein n=1 Tax=Opisthorchis viverrini TaxID=6198 RepID=A0A074ZVK5_OPIVI|nr:hypothetical protein T265_02277 [Opisthorchis viverrini]KER31508.1 hypothetical protein T265_02277 [Opisthorchis viverrini]
MRTEAPTSSLTVERWKPLIPVMSKSNPELFDQHKGKRNIASQLRTDYVVRNARFMYSTYKRQIVHTSRGNLSE